MNSTPILSIYVQLWSIVTTRQHWIFPLNQYTTFTELPLLYSHFLSIKSSYPTVSRITSKWEKPVALIKPLAKNCKRWVVFIHNFLNFAKKSFDDCMFPSQWKTAQVHYIHKREVLETGNYCPISLLSIPGKLQEGIACFHLDSFLNHHNLITDSQWGFRKGRSFELLLHRMTE